jgi:hypothetical protein
MALTSLSLYAACFMNRELSVTGAAGLAGGAAVAALLAAAALLGAGALGVALLEHPTRAIATAAIMAMAIGPPRPVDLLLVASMESSSFDWAESPALARLGGPLRAMRGVRGCDNLLDQPARAPAPVRLSAPITAAGAARRRASSSPAAVAPMTVASRPSREMASRWEGARCVAHGAPRDGAELAPLPFEDDQLRVDDTDDEMSASQVVEDPGDRTGDGVALGCSREDLGRDQSRSTVTLGRRPAQWPDRLSPGPTRSVESAEQIHDRARAAPL